MRMVFVTAPAEEAPVIARTLVEERLVACVNIVPQVRSVYSWDGCVQDDQEALLIMKTTADRLPSLTERVVALHSYSVPEVIAVALAPGEGNADYLQWLRESVRAPGAS